jgi:RimJ/RimL family protein N-acetyltransferase
MSADNLVGDLVRLTNELNLNRITLIVFEYNQRARRAYEKVGFVVEGRVREVMLRHGKRYDWLIMGVLREDWERNEDRIL